MHSIVLFVKGVGVGLAVAAPVGPMALLCMRRSLALGWQRGLATGLGIATGDGFYALVAAAGLTGLSHFLLAHARPLHFAAALSLFYFGFVTFRARPAGLSPEPGRGTYLGSVLLTLTNPPTIITFAAFFSVLAPRNGFDLGAAGLTVAGVFAGSLLWWCGLVAVIVSFRAAIGARARRLIDGIAGLFFVIFGLVELRRAIAR
ncbi:MAG TPA: LysE family transporter [Acetobacteraceae bacterium]|nr:LysE family transporter [Acetobacteraceae bacterium]